MSTNDPQRQMIREAMKSIAERKPGRTKLVYDKTKRTIVAVAEGTHDDDHAARRDRPAVSDGCNR